MTLHSNRAFAMLGICCMLLIVACSSAPRPIPFAVTRTLVGDSPKLAEIEQRIAAKKAEQDVLEQQVYELDEKVEKDSKNESLRKSRELAQKRSELCHAEMAALVGEHQLESAKLLKRPDIADREKSLSKLKDQINERRKAVDGGK